MSFEDTIARFGEQFQWQPEVTHSEALRPHQHVIVCGMGGSHLGAWMLKKYGGAHQIHIHRDYGLPDWPEEQLRESLVILSSYSGTTEEVLDSAREALGRGLSIAVISTGGKLIEFAREHALPHVVIPDMNLQPRLAIGLSMVGVARLLMDTDLEARVRSAGAAVDPMVGKAEGERLAASLHGHVPLFYASYRHIPLAYLWKIKCNETGKSPAFCNAVPEMCHNELCGFDVVESTSALSQNMMAVFLDDESDHPRNRVRMSAARAVLADKHIATERIALHGEGFDTLFNTALLADWTTLFLSRHYGVPDEAVPLVEDFKRRIG